MNGNYTSFNNGSRRGFPWGLVIFLILLIGMGIGGYFGYKKWWIPRQCNNKTDSNLYIDSFMWDGSNCVANTCTTGYGTDAKGKPANATPDGDKNTCPVFTASRTYNATSKTGKCVGGTAVSPSPSVKTQMDCGKSCDGANCTGFDWEDSPATCDLYTGAVTDGDGTTANFKCFVPQK